MKPENAEKPSNSTLLIIEETKELLEDYGEPEVVYLTAEFSPFSNQQKPDLQFVKRFYDDTLFFVEYKKLHSNELNLDYLKSILEHRDFVQSGTELKVFYGFSTNIDVNEEYSDFLKLNNVKVFPSVNDSERLFNCILDWTSASSY